MENLEKLGSGWMSLLYLRVVLDESTSSNKNRRRCIKETDLSKQTNKQKQNNTPHGKLLVAISSREILEYSWSIAKKCYKVKFKS